MTGAELLARYQATASEEAFAELVGRYANLVYSTARRRLSDGTLAEDATQAVFMRLAKALPKFNTDAELVAWLHRTALHVAIDLWRSETRRRTREQHAAAMQTAVTEENQDQLWAGLAPHLDEALNDLGDADRQAVLLRFFERQSMRDVGHVLGVSEDAAKMRVSRAIERLRTQLAARGVTCGAATMAALLADRSIEAAPPGLLLRLGTPAGPGPGRPAAPPPAPRAPGRATGFKLAGAAALVVVVTIFVAPRPAPPVVEAPPAPAEIEAPVPPTGTRPDAAIARRASVDATQAQAPSETKARLVFRVLDAETGQSLADAKVRAAYFYPGGRGEGHDLRTGPGGEALIPEAREGGNPGMNVFVSREGYVPKAIGIGGKSPPEYVLRLEPAAMAGGVVVDEQGTPVPGVQLQANRSENYVDGQPNTDFQTTQAETDAQGRWVYYHVPRTYTEVGFTLTREGYAVTMASVQMGTPEALSARLVIRRGFVVAGLVTDSGGRPIPGAKVSEFHNYGHRKLSTETDPHGAYQLAGVSNPLEGTMEIVVQAAGMAPELRVVPLRQATNRVDFTLAKGNLFRGRVVDESGRPIPGAAARTDSDDRGRQPFRWFARTDSEGRFEWDSAPGEPLLFWFEADGYMPIRDRVLQADGTEHEIQLKRQAGGRP